MNNIKVIICDDMPYVSECFKVVLDNFDDISVIGIANSASELFKLLEKTQPDVLLLDIQLSYSNEGIDILKKTKNLYPKIKVIMLTVHEEDEFIFQSIAAGAADYLLKSDTTLSIETTIRNAYNNVMTLNPYISQKLVSECVKTKNFQEKALSLLNCIALLTASEYKVLQLVYNGHSYAEIAQQRFVEEVTIRTQISKILKKFDKKNVNELIEELKQIQFFDFEINNTEKSKKTDF